MQIKPDTKKLIFCGLAALSLTLTSAVPASAVAVTDPPNDILPTFNRAFRGDLDILSANVTLDGSNFVFTGTVKEPVGESENDAYVFGLNRGMGTSKFGNIGNPNVVFDATFALRPGGGSSVTDLITSTTTQISDVTIVGNTFTGTVPLSLLPSEGFDPSNDTYNLWALVGSPEADNTGISDFAIDNGVAPVSSAGMNAAPEPGTLSLLAMAGAGVLAVGIRRKSAR